MSIILISEATPLRSEDGFYSSDTAVFAQTTLQAFRDAGANVTSVTELLRQDGVWD